MKKSLPILGQEAAAPERLAWRSLAEHDAGEASAEEVPHDLAFWPEGLSRRGFLQLMGASAALAGLAACRPPRHQIHAYVRQPEQALFPGNPVPYATALALGGEAVGLLVTTNEGRPTKVEGNPDHPSSLGAAGKFEQAALLDLYDPRRASGFTRKGQPLALRTVLRELAALGDAHAADGGARLRFLVGATGSPLLLDLRRRILERFPKARFTAYESLSSDASREGARVAFGRPLAARHHLERADVILALDADFLDHGPEALRLARAFASRRAAPGPGMSRLYAVEAHLSVTGSNADHRFRMRPSQVLGFGRQVAAQLARKHGFTTLAPLSEGVEPSREAAAVADDLARVRGAALVVAGERQPPAVHALAHALNAALGAAGKTVEYAAPAIDEGTGAAGLAALAKELQAGAVDTLVVTAFDPVYTGPGDLDLEALFTTKVPNLLYLAFREDETSARASWVLARSHPFEHWGDARAHDGTITLQQPLLQPLFESLSEAELLAAFLPGEGDKGSYRLVQELWRARSAGPGFDARWGQWLAKGVVPGTAAAPESAAPDLAAVAAAIRAVKPAGESLEVSFIPDPKLWDGRFAENAWLQELPEPMTKLTWDNAAMVSLRTSKELKVSTGSRVELRLRGRKVDAPVLVVPGHADGVVTVALGYGRQRAGPVGSGVGFDAGALRGGEHPWFEAGLAVAPIGKRRHKFAQTQEHFSMEGRGHALVMGAAELHEKQHELEERRGPVPTIQAPVDYQEQAYKWGMAIDLSRCIGCGICTIACQAENNIPVVGKEQVMRSREMHWLRVDRYFEGPVDDPTSVAQPMMCVHCETAPCEYVCPVNATVHSDEGLNEMVYNRCVGTRYCSNNCPYKVRRFNFLDYTSGKAPTEKMLMNPDVTVRARGVMEKCTYCVQRIERARIGERVAGQKGKAAGTFTTACAQACPAQAITFGNLNDAAAAVSRQHADERRYDVLHELGTRPRTAYLVRLRNPNPALET